MSSCDDDDDDGDGDDDFLHLIHSPSPHHLHSVVGLATVLLIHYRSKVTYLRQLRANALLFGVFIMPMSMDVVVRLHTPFAKKEYSFHRDHLRRADVFWRPSLRRCGKMECLVLEGK